VKIGIARPKEASRIYMYEDLGSGCENMAYALHNRCWYNLEDTLVEKFDAVLCVGTSDMLKAILKKGRPKAEKLVLMQQTGMNVFNCPQYVDLVKQVGFDAVIINCKSLKDLYSVFDVPVFHYILPYPLDKQPELRHQQRKRNRIYLNLNRPSCTHTNILGTLQVFRGLPDVTEAVSYVINEREIPALNKLIVYMGLKDRVKVFKPVRWDLYIKEVAKCSIVVCMENQYTWGRTAIDAAHVGIYCVGAQSGAMDLLYPGCIRKCTDISGAIIDVALQANSRYKISKEVKRQLSHDYFLKDITQKLEGLWMK
jgi:hypothetical protein